MEKEKELPEEIMEESSEVNESSESASMEQQEEPKEETITDGLDGLEEIVSEKNKKSTKPVGYLFRGIEFSRDGFLKVLSSLGIGYNWKTKNDKKFWIIDNDNYLITDNQDGNSFDNKFDLYIVSDEKSREHLVDIIKSKALSYDEKSEIYEAPCLRGLADGITSDENDPILSMPYHILNSTIEDIYKLESATELITLMELSHGKRYACGCGHI